MDVINIISIIVSPIIAVIVGQILQNNSKKRAEKLEIFKTLMVSRGLGWSVERRSFLKRERRLKGFLKNEYFKVCLNEVSRDLGLSETL